MAENPKGNAPDLTFKFLKGGENAVSPKSGQHFDWGTAAATVREHLSDAMNTRNVAFLMGSGCSSYLSEKKAQLGIPTMAPMAQEFLGKKGSGNSEFITASEDALLKEKLGLDVGNEKFEKNLERLMEVLYAYDFVLSGSGNKTLSGAAKTVSDVIKKISKFVVKCCSEGAFAKSDQTVCDLYQNFYRKLVYRDRALPIPWIFTTNYDLFNEVAMDRLSIPYGNGFSGTVERRFNPATFRHSLAEQLDITSRKWSAVDSFVYLCKLHGSINWVDREGGLFPIQETQSVASNSERVMIYPTPAKQNASFASPYSDLFREFQSRVVRDQSVLFVLGYSFADEHVNNIIFQALTVPTFRMIAFAPLELPGVVTQLAALNDPRIWFIGGGGPNENRFAHYFDTFVEHFMPETPSDKIDKAITKVLENFVARKGKESKSDGV
ncbi:MAG: SIR2 family protein [Alphaproteobacteria bacterium]